MKKGIWHRRTPTTFSNGKWTYKFEDVEVEVMAVVKGYAMARRKGCYPFVVSVNKPSPVREGFTLLP